MSGVGSAVVGAPCLPSVPVWRSPSSRTAPSPSHDPQIKSCEHAFVTSQGSAYSQFKQALSRGNFLLAWALAEDLPRVPLTDALCLLLLARDHCMRCAARARRPAVMLSSPSVKPTA